MTWRLGDPIPPIIESKVIQAFTARKRWRRSKTKMFSNLACGHQVCHGVYGSKAQPKVGDMIVCRRCTKEARRDDD